MTEHLLPKDQELVRMAEEISAKTGEPVTATMLQKLAHQFDQEINAPLPHHTPSLARINHHWRNR